MIIAQSQEISDLANDLSNIPHNNNGRDEPPLHYLIRAARIIVQNDAIHSIPKYVAADLLDAIELRAKCLTWFSGNTHQNDTETRAVNEEHRNIIIELQAVVEILLPKLPRNYHNYSINRTTIENITAHDDTLVNAFELLQLYEPRERLADEVEETMQRTVFTKRTNSDARKRQREAELDLAVFCFFSELNAIANEIFKEMCRCALTDDYDSILPILTNFAVDRAHAMEDELTARFPYWRLSTSHAYRQRQSQGGFSQDPILRMAALLAHQLSYLIARGANGGTLKLNGKNVEENEEHIQIACQNYASDPFNVSAGSNIELPTSLDADVDTQAVAEEHFIARLINAASAENLEKADSLGQLFDQTTEFAKTASVQYREGFLENDYAAELFPVHVAFAIRLRYLSQVVLGAHGEQSDHSIDVSRKHLLRTAVKVGVACEQFMIEVQKPQHGFQDAIKGPATLLRMLDSPKSQAARAKELLRSQETQYLLAPLQCDAMALNMQIGYNETAIVSIDLCNVVAMAGQFWHLFKLEGLELPESKDMKFIMEHLTEAFIHHGSPAKSKSMVANCFFHSQGIDPKKAKKMIKDGKVIEVDGMKVR